MSDYPIQIDPNVLNHLGMSLYSNTPAVLTEIISNAWDADANEVKIELNTTLQEVTIVDDGHGMSEDDLKSKFLKVGYARRDQGREKSDKNGRQVMGRKGIGKLAMFSLANKIQVHSKRDDHPPQAFEVDVEALQTAIRNRQAYSATPIQPNHDEEAKSGTIIKLIELKRSIDRTQSYLRKRIARRFSIIGEKHNFEVEINGTPISLDDRDFLKDIEFLWEFGPSDPHRISSCKNHTKQKVMDSRVSYKGEDFSISGYIGSVVLPSQLKKDPEISNNTVTVISNGRVFEEDILLEFGSAKVFTSYLVGELIVDFLDDNELPDMATSSRQKLQQNDPRYPVLKGFFERALQQIDKDWDTWRREKGAEDAKKNSQALSDWLGSLKSSEQKAATNLIGKVNTFRFSGDEKGQLEAKRTVMKNTVLAFEKLRIKDNLDELSKIKDLSSENFKSVFASIDDIEASMFYEITSQRLQVIDKFQKITDDNELERVVQQYLYDHLWLLDPSWERVTGKTYIEQTLTNELKQVQPDAKSGARIDIAFKTVSGRHVIIEMKRPKVTPPIPDLVAQGKKYLDASTQWYKNNPKSCIGGKPPVIEVIFLLGKGYTNEDPTYLNGQLMSVNGKILTYSDLITQSQQSYKEYHDKKTEAARIRNLIDSI